MYRGASQALQHAHRVNRPMPTGGLMGADSAVETDFIPSAANMGVEECRAELRQLGIELVRAEQELAVAKRSGTEEEVRLLGHRIQAIVQRRGLFKQRLQAIRDQDPGAILADAIRQTVSDEIAGAIFKRAGELEKERFGC